MKDDGRHGKGLYFFAPKRDLIKVYEGDFQDDNLHGKGYMYENDREFEIEFEYGKEKNVIEIETEKRKNKIPTMNKLDSVADSKKGDTSQQQQANKAPEKKAEPAQQKKK